LEYNILNRGRGKSEVYKEVGFDSLYLYSTKNKTLELYCGIITPYSIHNT
jgi:hypothetical protein